jgi:hypothetical protein
MLSLLRTFLVLQNVVSTIYFCERRERERERERETDRERGGRVEILRF